jgi:phage-related protein
MSLTGGEWQWSPDRGSGREHEYRTRENEFEDYTQVTPRGLRPVKYVYSLTFKRAHAVIQQMVSFLDDHVGKTFLFIDPTVGNFKRVRAEKPRVRFVGGTHSVLTVTFHEHPLEL